MQRMLMQEIIDNYANGNLREMTRLIDEYGFYDFPADLKTYVVSRISPADEAFDAYTAIIISYSRVKYR